MFTALLPMKGHSERVPNKNMKSFAGKPLYHAIMQTLEESHHIKKIIINTDSEVIAEDALQNFKKVVIAKRPTELQGDFVPMNDIINYDMNATQEDFFLQTHSTNPLLKVQTLNEAIERFLHNQDKHDSLFSVTRLQTRLYWKDGKAINHNPTELLRTQDLPPVFEENSNFYLFTKRSFAASGKKRIGLRPMMFEVSKLEAIDIDESEDFVIAELLYKKLHKQEEKINK